MDTAATRDAAFAASVVSDLMKRIMLVRCDLGGLGLSQFDQGRCVASLNVALDALACTDFVLGKSQEVAK